MNEKAGINTWYIPHRSRISIFLLILSLSFPVRIHAQAIAVDADNEPLNQVLMRVARQYSVQLSFDDRQLSDYTISVHQEFEDPQQAIAFLIRDYPLDFKQIGEVYTLYSTYRAELPVNHLLSGRVIDARNGETLPFSNIVINQSGAITDLNGNFSFVSTDSLFSLKVSYLGYYIKDTTLSPGTGYTIELIPSIIGLKEVVIEGSMVERSGETGDEPGVMRLNHKIANRLPGNGDNAVFNFLRLQPGILAAGERSSELIIWGSYSGQSKIMFDGFTVFGLKNFNDNISFVNPYMAKDIKVLKGGYGVDYEDRVGGIVDISGINGDIRKPSINLNINNMTVNGMASVPINKRSSLTLAYRHTYYNLVDAGDLNVISGGRRTSDRYDINIYPDYLFRDFNVKYAGSTAKGDNYFISLYEGKDLFSYDVEEQRNNADISQNVDEKNRQLGGSAFYGKTWNNGVNSHLSINISALNNELYEKQVVNRTSGMGGNSRWTGREAMFKNDVYEVNIRNKIRIPISERQMIETGWNYTLEDVNYSVDSLDQNQVNSTVQSHRIGLYLQDEFSPVERLSIRPGIRVDYPFHLQTVYIQPRIQVSLDLSDHWKLNGAAGIYNQFISEIPVTDELGNRRYIWAVCDNEDVPVLKANHFVGGISYKTNGLTIGAEGFYKTTSGITRFVDLWRLDIHNAYQGEARMYGMDLLIKQYFRKHEVWASYTLSRTEEHFPNYPTDEYYMDAPQDQRHEVKGALLLNFSPIFFSVNYVYGSGFQPPPSLLDSQQERYPYSRLDVALFYRHHIRDYHFEIGISVLNLLNHENVKYSNVVRIPDSLTSTISVNAEAVPLTPTIYLNMAF